MHVIVLFSLYFRYIYFLFVVFEVFERILNNTELYEQLFDGFDAFQLVKYGSEFESLIIVQ